MVVGVAVKPLDRDQTRKTNAPGFDPHPEVETGYSQLPDYLALDEFVHPDGAKPENDMWGFSEETRARDREAEARESRQFTRSRENRITVDEATGGGPPLFGEEE